MEFLANPVQIPDEDDWKKLVRLLRYLKCNIYLPCVMRADSLNAIKRWVDASYADHTNCRGHTVVMMLMGKASILSSCRKQKINRTISTEADMVVTHDISGQLLWT